MLMTTFIFLVKRKQDHLSKVSINNRNEFRKKRPRITKWQKYYKLSLILIIGFQNFRTLQPTYAYLQIGEFY